MQSFRTLLGGVWLLCAATVAAQQSASSSAVTAVVVDGSGAAVSGAVVTIRNLDRNQSVATTSDHAGRFRFSFLPASRYELRVEAAGFVPVARHFTLTAGQALELTIRLAVAGANQSIMVSSEVPLVEAARTQVASAVVAREIEGIPLNGRNYLDLALLVPGVSRTNTGSVQRFAETSAVPGTGISVAGQRNLNNSFVVDGLSANDDAAALAGTFFSQEVIREFQVITSGGIAELGRASSGVIHIVTRSGTNDWRGRLYGFLRNQRLDARNPLARAQDPLTQAQYGATLGGPLRRDRTFLFSNFEATRQHRAGFVTIAPASVDAVNRELDRFGYAGPRADTGEFPTGYDSTNFFLRGDHQIRSGHTLAARYSLYDIASWNARTVGGLSARSRGTGLADRDQAVAINDVASLSQRTVHEARLQFTRSRLAAPVNDSVGPAVNISGVASFGTATSSPTGRDLDVFEAADTLSFLQRAHSVRAGANLLWNRPDITFPGAIQGVYTFGSTAALQSGRYITFQQAFGEPRQFQSNPNLGFFLQDEWRVHPALTLNLGVRYDVQWLPGPIRADRNNVAPRFGVAYAPGNRRTVVRASFGLFYDRIPLRATSNALQRDGSKYRVAVLAFGQSGAPDWPAVLPVFPAGLLTAITTIDPRIQAGGSEQASLQVERELGPTRSFSVGYVRLRGLRLLLSRNVNVPTLSADEATRLGVSNLGRPDPRYMNVNRYESSGDSYFDGMTFSFDQRASRWGTLRVSYTLSKAIDDAGNFFFSSPQDNFNLRGDRGLSDNDQRQRLTLSGSLAAPAAPASRFARALAGFEMTYLFAYTSALPFNVVTGTDRNNDTNVNDRPAGVGRNTGVGFDFASLDLRLARRFRWRENRTLELIVESFNSLNRSNFMVPNNVFGTGAGPLASFGRPTAAADPRQVQIGIRVGF
jgi:hypothetical protein